MTQFELTEKQRIMLEVACNHVMADEELLESLGYDPELYKLGFKDDNDIYQTLEELVINTTTGLIGQED